MTYRLPRSPSPDPLLSPSHPDFAPSTDCAPRLLFPEARTHARDADAAPAQAPRRSEGRVAPGEGGGKGKAKARARESEWDTSDEEGEAVVAAPVPVAVPVRAAVGWPHSVDAVVLVAGVAATSDAVPATAEDATVMLPVSDAVQDSVKDSDVAQDIAKAATATKKRKPSSRAIANLPLRRSSRLAAQAAGKR